jgi:hypothetical protein
VGVEVHDHTSNRSQCSVERWTVTANSRVSPAGFSLEGGKQGAIITESRAILGFVYMGTAARARPGLFVYVCGNEVHEGVEGRERVPS